MLFWNHYTRAHIRGPWSMSHLRGYSEGIQNHYKFKSINEEATWLESNDKQLFDNSFLNSNELNKWAAKASGRLFGKDAKN